MSYTPPPSDDIVFDLQAYSPPDADELAFELAAAAVTLEPALVTNTNAFYSPTVTPGPVTLSASLYTDADIFYSPTVTRGAVTLAPGVLVNATSFFAPTVSSIATIAPGLLVNTSAFFSPSISTQQLVQPSLFGNVNIFFAPDVSVGPVTLYPSLFINGGGSGTAAIAVSNYGAAMLRKNVSGQHLFFMLLDAAGQPVTGATVTARRTLDGGAQEACTGSVTSLGNGQYAIALSAADTNANNCGYLFSASGAIPVSIGCVLTAADPTDAAGFGLSRLDAAVGSRSTYDGADSPGVRTLLARFTNMRFSNQRGPVRP